MEKRKLQKNTGAAMMILLFFFVIISMTILLGVVVPVVREYGIANSSLASRQAYFNAESGMEDIMYRIKNGMDTGTVGDDRTLLLGDSYVSVPMTITNGLNNKKYISITGDVKNRQRNVDVTLTTSTGVSFNYGVLVGQGGVYIDSGTVNGNLYANGPITASSSGSNIITGTAISANSPDNSSADQTNGSGTPAYSVTFANANATQDIAQSFKVSTAKALNKIQLYIKKYGSPSDATIKIMNDSSGSPGSTVLASGTMSASAITTSYGWVNISFTSNPLLSTGTTYWLVVDASASNKNYYILGASSSTYANGLGKIGQLGSSWSSTTPSGLDYFFSVYLGGINGLIQGYGPYNQIRIGTTSGTAQAHTVNNATVTGNIYCQSGTGNNKSCSSSTDPVYIEFPVSEANITEWKNDASSGGTYSGNYSVGWAGATLGPKKINGNLSVNGGGILNMTGNLWVTGNLTLNGGGTIKLDSSYGTDDAVIVVDGTIDVSGGGHATGSGATGSYIMLLTTSSSASAANVSGGAGAVIMYAPNGTLTITGGASLKEATAYKINLGGGASITYESGLTDNNFSSGPSGSWSIDAWGESE